MTHAESHLGKGSEGGYGVEGDRGKLRGSGKIDSEEWDGRE